MTPNPGPGTARGDDSQESSVSKSTRNASILRAGLRFSILAVILVAAFVALRWGPLGTVFTREYMVDLLLDWREIWWAPIALIALYLVVSPMGLPVSPLIVAGGVTFGIGWGWLYNFIGCMLGATASYLLALALGRDLVAQLAGEELVQRVEKTLDQHGFWTLVRVRFVPMPFVIINFGAALSGFKLPQFIAASALGLAPSLVIYTYFGHALFHAAAGGHGAILRNLGGVIVVLLLFTFVPTLRRLWKKRRYGS